jgi:hypothetical protein
MIPANQNAPEEAPARPLTVRWQRVTAIASTVVGLSCAAVPLFILLEKPPLAEPLSPNNGFVDVCIVAPDNPQRGHIRLNQKDALPLRKGDQVRVEVELNRPAFVYLIWIDSAGHVTPLYPWRSGRWSRLVNQEKPVDRLSLPDDRKEGYDITGAKPGMETVLLLARDDVLTPEPELAGLLFDLDPVRAQNPQAVVWFENGTVVRDEANRTFTSFDPNGGDDPLSQMQAFLTKRLQPFFSYSRAVSFANAGR